MSLDSKIQGAIQLLKDNEELALKLNTDGYYVAFSGGKDSQVIYELCKMAGVKFKAHFSLTTVDPMELLRFIRSKYPDVIIHRPQKSMSKLIAENRSLPLKQIPYCCRLIKEIHGVDNLVVNGIRKQESNDRKNKKASVTHICVMGQDKFILSPIVDWDKKEVWGFIRKHIGFYCELYDDGFERIGCIFCPNASPRIKIKQLKRFPRFKLLYLKAIQKCIEYGNYKDFDGAEDVFMWWISGIPKRKWFAMKNQTKLDL